MAGDLRSCSRRRNVKANNIAGRLSKHNTRIIRRQKFCSNPRQEARADVREIYMPALSSTMTEGKIVQWLKNEGDNVERGESIAVVESDKADMDVESFHSGTVASILADEESVAPVGNIIGFLAETDDDVAAAKERAQSLVQDGASTASPESSTSDANIGANEAPSSDGNEAPQPQESPAPVAASHGPAEPASSSATTEAPAQQAQPQPSQTQPESAPAAAPAAQPQAPTRTDGKIIATPYAKKRAKELKVDLEHVVGTGLAGRITAPDVEAAASSSSAAIAAPFASAQQQEEQQQQPQQEEASKQKSPQAAPSPTPGPSRELSAAPVGDLSGKVVPLSSMQSMVAKNMEQTVNVPVSRLAISLYTEELDALYAKIKDKGVSMTALLAKAVGNAIADNPLMGATLVQNGSAVQYPEELNIACAVALEDGLVTPVLRDVTQTDVYTMGRQWKDLVKRARNNSLSKDELSTGVFTITNLGMYGIEQFDAILPPGQAGILAVGASQWVVEADERGFIGQRKKMTVNVTADHRFVNGDKAAEFLQSLKQQVEQNPQNLLLT